MIKLKSGQEKSIFPLVHERIAEANLQGRTDAKFTETMISLNLSMGALDVFVDREEDPRAILLITSGRLSILSEEVAIINVIHVAESARADPKVSLVLFKAAINHAKAHARFCKASCLRASSWVWRSSPDISSLLEKEGFELQSHDYAHFLNETP